MLQKLIQNKWTIIAIVLAIIVVYYFYQKNQTSDTVREPLLRR